MKSKTEPETVRRTFMNSNGRWYTVALMPDGVRISLDFDDKKMAQEVADADLNGASGVLTHIRYESITDVFVDHARSEATIGTTDGLFVLPGWKAKMPPFLKIARASVKDLKAGNRLADEHEDRQPINVFMKHVGEQAGLVFVTERYAAIERLERPGSQTADQNDPTKPIPTIWSPWQMIRSLIMFTIAAFFLWNVPQLDNEIRIAAAAICLVVAVRMASTRVTFDDDSIVIHNALRRRTLSASEIEAFSILDQGGSWPLQSGNVIVAKTESHRWQPLRATLSLTASRAQKVSRTVRAFAQRNQIPNSIHPDHMSPLINRGNRKITKAGVNLRRLNTRK